MKHWFLYDSEGTQIGHISLDERCDIPKLITSGHDFKLSAEYLPGSDSPKYFIAIPT